MPRTAKKPICRFIAAAVTSSIEYRSLSADGPTKLLFLFLLIHPHGGSFHVPGLYPIGPKTLQETSNLPSKVFKKAFNELQDKKLLQVDSSAQLVWFPAALQLMGPPANPNMVIGYSRSIQQMPSCDLLETAIDAYAVFLGQLGGSFLRPFTEAFGNRFETVTETMTRQPLAPDETVEETYIDSDNDMNRYNQINKSHQGETPEEYLMQSLRVIADASAWPAPQPERVKQQILDLPGLTRDELRTCQHLVAGRAGLRDPWAYFFKVLKQSRIDLHRGAAEGDAAAKGIDPFAGFQDGQEVSFYEA